MWGRGWCAASSAPAPRLRSPMAAGESREELRAGGLLPLPPDGGRPFPPAPPLPPSARAIAALLMPALRPGESAWFVGGMLRDLLSGRPAVDVDVVVAGDAARLAAAVADGLGGAVFTYSERFSAYRVVTGEGHVDFSAPRGKTLEDDLRARDFTVDAIACDLSGERLEDPLGGVIDLGERRLRLCSPDALAADPLRVLRLVRIEQTFGLLPDAAALAAALAAAPALASVSGERIAQELSAILALPKRVSALHGLDALGALAVILPELTALKGCTQNPYHHLDVFAHTMEALGHLPGVVEQLGGERWLAAPEAAGLAGVAPIVPLAYATLFHDLGKPSVRKVDEQDHVMFWYHDQIGAELVAGIARRLKMSRRFEHYLALLVREHLRLGFLAREAPLTRRALARYRRDVDPYVFESVALSLADRVATRGPKTSLRSIARHFRLARDVWGEVAKQSVPNLLDGNAVMRLLGLSEGPEVGEALAALREEVEAGEVSTVGQAEKFLRGWAARPPAAAPPTAETAPGDTDMPADA
jgi:poly(A) polymerase